MRGYSTVLMLMQDEDIPVIHRLRTFLALVALLPLCVGLSAQAQGSTPADTVSAFLTAWGERDSAAMYQLLAVQSQQAYPQELFVNRYTVANDALSLEGVEFSIGDTHLQGITAAVTYDVGAVWPHRRPRTHHATRQRQRALGRGVVEHGHLRPASVSRPNHLDRSAPAPRQYL
ncbi:MAG: hypothetical protein MUF38_13980 [Anaerolineae bacterium]|nr:hypothetical protein [Anaerolineae bacterium]